MTELADLAAIAELVDWADSAAGGQVREALELRPDLGRLAELASWVATVRGDRPGAPFERVRCVVFGADEVTLAASDVVIDGAAIRPMGSQGVDVAAAVAAGAAAADEEIDRGADLLVAAYPGVPATVPITISVMTSTEPVKVLARGAAATDPQAWMALATQVRDERRRCIPLRDDPDRLLAAVGNPDLAAAAGFVLQAAARRTPVLLDGPAAVAAGLVAYEAQPRAIRWWYAADGATDPGQALALTRLGLAAVLDLGTAIGDGAAALLAVPVLRAAGRLASSVRTPIVDTPEAAESAEADEPDEPHEAREPAEAAEPAEAMDETERTEPAELDRPRETDPSVSVSAEDPAEDAPPG